MILVSVIIPVYNVEKYLKKCIDTLINQTLKEIEFIFINDGSTDASRNIVETYQQNDRRILLINQENHGVSVARNKGIKIAKGQYISFIDSDDFLELDFFKKLYKTAIDNSIDIVVSNFYKELNGVVTETKAHPLPYGIYNQKDIQKSIIPFFLKEDSLNSCCNKIYKTDLIKSNKINFPLGITNGEDALFNLQSFNKAIKVQFIDYAGYHYRVVAGSATRNILNKDYFKIALDVYNFNHVLEYKLSLSKAEATKLKSIRFITTVVSIMHIYLKPNSQIPFKQRFLYVKNMITNKHVQDATHKNWAALIINKGKYQQLVLNCVKIKCILGLLLLTAYSNIRNKS